MEYNINPLGTVLGTRIGFCCCAHLYVDISARTALTPVNLRGVRVVESYQILRPSYSPSCIFIRTASAIPASRAVILSSSVNLLRVT